MLFKDIKPNYPVYILNKQDTTFLTGKVVSVSFPRMDNNMSSQQNNPLSFMNPGSNNRMVVDVTIEAAGKTATYVIPENMDSVTAGDMVLSTDREPILREVEAIHNNAEQYFKNQDKMKQALDRSTELMMELNPGLKEKQEMEKRMSKIEESVAELKGMASSINDLSGMVKGLVAELKGG